ncbi:hypothetical protein [Pseudophaeobacter sp.]
MGLLPSAALILGHGETLTVTDIYRSFSGALDGNADPITYCVP